MHLNGAVHAHDSLLVSDALHAPRAALGVARTARALATLRMAPAALL